jgi:hypothetical protein
MAHKFRQLRVVPKPQREHVAVATDHDGFPPPVVEGFLGEVVAIKGLLSQR